LTAIYVPANSTGWTHGTPGDDMIIGTDGPELINGGGGDDTAIFDEDIDQVWNCETLVEYSGPTEDGE
jgi:hypothetical protein